MIETAILLGQLLIGGVILLIVLFIILEWLTS